MSTTGHENEAINVQGLKASLQKFKNEQVDSGAHPDFTAGNVVGEFSDTGAEFAYRPTAGAVDIESGIADHGGHLQVIKGNTVAWNQLVKKDGSSLQKNVNTTTVTPGGDFDATAVFSSGLYNGFSLSIGQLKLGCKFYIHIKVLYHKRISVGFGGVTYNFTPVNNTIDESFISSVTKASSAFTITDPAEVSSETSMYAKVQVINLTLIYGAGNEPETVAAFKADYMKWFGKPLAYEDYDAGSLRPVKMTGIKTVGFNQWDEEWEVGAYNTFADGQDGSKYDGIDTVRCKNLIPVLPNTDYFCKTPYGITIGFYDSNSIYLGYTGTKIYRMNQIVTTPSNAYYMSFYVDEPQYGTTYNHDICINLHHSGDRDGEYEPYWESQLNVPITTLKGKLNGAGSSVVVFPDGMKKVGSVYDEIVRRGDKTYAIKRVGSVDLGTLTWTLNKLHPENVYYFDSSGITDMKHITSQTILGNIVCSKYRIIENANWHSSVDKTISQNTTHHLGVVDNDFTDTASFKTAINGVYLYYELATPEEYLLDDFELPQDYDVDDWGTEEILLGTNGCAPVLDLKYGINAGDTIKNLPHNYVSINRQNFSEGQQAIARQNIGAASQEDMIRVKEQLEAIIPKVDNDYFVDMGLPSGILWAKRNIDLSQADGFAASEYQYEGSFFSWGNTDGHNPTGNNTFSPYNWGTGNNTEPYKSSEGAKLTGDITPSFDAARVNLGAPWRMPTKEDFAELFNSAYTKFIDASGNDIAPSTTNKLVTMNGVVGIRLKSLINGNIIFFPCSGYGDGSSLNYSASFGFYWSASLDIASNGCVFDFGSNGVYPHGSRSRYLGLPVRPVM